MAKRKKKQLTGLAAALVQSGHLDDKKARKLTREQKREDKSVGVDEVAARKAADLQAAAERKAAELAGREAANLDEKRAEIRGMVRAEAASGWQGRRRWFYVRRDQRLSYLEFSDEMARLMRGGQAAIVEGFDEDEGQHFVLKDPLLIGRVRVEDPTHVRFWNQADLAQ